MSEISMGTLYDMNKVAVSKLPQISDEEFQQKLKEIKWFFLSKPDKYFMLLNRETYNFTLFNLGNKKVIPMENAILDLEECLINRGTVISIEQDSMGNYEIWIRDGEEQLVYYLFPYDAGVIEHGQHGQEGRDD